MTSTLDLPKIAGHARRVALLASLLLALAGAAWTVVPSWMPFTGLAERHINALLPAHLVGAPLALLGTVGAAAILWSHRLPQGALSGVAILELAFLTTVYQGPGTMSALGYIFALSLPLVLFTLLVLVVVRMPRWRWPVLLVVGAAVAAGVLTGPFSASDIGGMYRFVGTMAGMAPFALSALLILAATVSWGMLLGARYPEPVRRMTAAVVRNRRWITVAAAACALPYALLRFLWLTPFHLEDLLDLPGSPESLDPAVKLWGLSIGAACLVGGILILGLIRPWGELFPRWFPGYAGRPVPIALAAVPALIAAGAMLVESPHLLVLAFQDPPQSLLRVLLFPFPVWGPLLALAAWGYVGYRLGKPPARTGV